MTEVTAKKIYGNGALFPLEEVNSQRFKRRNFLAHKQSASSRPLHQIYQNHWTMMRQASQRITNKEIRSSNDESSLVLLSKLGKAVWVLFKDQEDGEEEFYRGEIKQVHLKKTENDRSYSIKHYIVFDDGDQMWFDDIQTMEEIGELRWVAPAPQVEGAPQQDEEEDEEEEEVFVEKKITNRAAVPNHRRHRSAKREVPREVTVDTSAFENKKKRHRISYKKHDEEEKVKEEMDDNDDLLDEENDDDDDSLDDEEVDDDLDDDFSVATEVTFKDEDYQFIYTRDDRKRPFKALEPKTKTWVKQLGLQNAHGTGMRGLASIGACNYVEPDTFELLFRLADFLFPGQDCHYRLFASAKRPGLKVRQKLRDLKRQGEPALACYQYRQDWTPPNKQSLVFIMDIIQDM